MAIYNLELLIYASFMIIWMDFSFLFVQCFHFDQVPRLQILFHFFLYQALLLIMIFIFTIVFFLNCFLYIVFQEIVIFLNVFIFQYLLSILHHFQIYLVLNDYLVFAYRLINYCDERKVIFLQNFYFDP